MPACDGPPRRYFDNAATSFPKPRDVAQAVHTWATTNGASPGRGAYEESLDAAATIESCRGQVADLIGASSPDQIVFTLNCTDALTLAIEGICRAARRRGEATHIVTTAMDHNSVLRPLNDLAADDVRHTIVRADETTGLVDPDDIAEAIEVTTRLVCVVHGSNVSGTIQPIAAIAERCRSAGVPLLVDAAQTIGHRRVDVDALGIDLLAFPGHKGLLGPLGTGGLWLRPGLEEAVAPVRLGGTGSRSDSPVHPVELPDRYEAGSHNTPGLVGLEAALSWIRTECIDVLEALESRLTAHMLERLLGVDGLRLHGPGTHEHICGVFSVSIPGRGPTEVADALEQRHGILTRPGVHCAPLAHSTLGTLELGGTVRLSIGPFTTMDDIDAAADALAHEVAVPTLMSATP